MTVLPLLLAATAAVAPAQAGERPEPAPPVRTEELRNPFWPVDKYNTYFKAGKTECITSEPVVAPQTAEAKSGPRTAADAAAEVAKAEERQKRDREVSPQTWARATAETIKVRPGMINKETGMATFQINGRVYSYGDFISADYKGHRFTWRLHPANDPTDITKPPRFEQIRVIRLEDENNQERKDTP